MREQRRTRHGPTTSGRRLLGAAALATLLALPVACSGARGREAGFGLCQQSVAWGGWDGTPQCAGLSATVIAAEDRACETDADCALVAVTTCAAHAVNQQALPRYSQMPAPCSHPLGGMCMPVTYRAACSGGCCIPANAALPPPGGLPR
jgi:hypothetical protein